ncbi:MAG: putative transcriptional regulator [Methanophagales archaeon]|nr:putative transcriptional regulator [Methanophagales archaeon]RLG34839.1 MAG: transcriptional regulator [Methanosarcinales archaeon]
MSDEVIFEEVLRSLRRSRVRTEIVMYLYKIYPKASYPAEISRNTGIDPTNILGGLRGMGSRFNESTSLLTQGVVEKIEREKGTYYRLSARGKSLIESMRKL